MHMVIRKNDIGHLHRALSIQQSKYLPALLESHPPQIQPIRLWT